MPAAVNNAVPLIDSYLTLAAIHNGRVITLFSLGLPAQAYKLLETEK
ncbi:MAG: hypothetical protein HWQ41_14605 [Nostoc sp. NOS(2021)]|nr:hypothetical protein [Nostoc sp. NOS(2021)]MBN3896442.1 hypothetical protein [Nostoc sp. NOS(2021)]